MLNGGNLIRDGDNNSNNGMGGEKIYNSEKKEAGVSFFLRIIFWTHHHLYRY